MADMRIAITEKAVEAMLNSIFGELRDEASLGELLEGLGFQVDDADASAVAEDVLQRMEIANKVMLREGKIQLL